MSRNQLKMYGYEDNMINEIEELRAEMRRDKLEAVQKQVMIDQQFVARHRGYRLTRRLTYLTLGLIFLIVLAIGAMIAYLIVTRKTDPLSKPEPAVPDYQASRIGAMDMRVREIAMDFETQVKLSVAMKMRLREMQLDMETQEKRLDVVERRVKLLERNASLHGQQLSNVNERVREMAGNVEQQNYGVFLWRIDRWASRRDSALSGIGIDSDAFFSDKNGYRMRLSLRPADQPKGQRPICIYWHLLRGPYDSILTWPFQRPVTLSLINQRTRTDHASCTLKLDQRGSAVAWSRPAGNTNAGICFDLPLSFDELSHNQALCGNDQVFIRCVLGSITRSRSSRVITELGLSLLLVLVSLTRF